MIYFKLDATSEIGSGHAARCIAISKMLDLLGVGYCFLVSCKESMDYFNSLGYEAVNIGGDPFRYDKRTAKAILDACNDPVSALLIDSYAATESFFEELHGNPRIFCAYIDDQYSYELGQGAFPRKYEIDMVISYGFYSKMSEYREAYGDGKVKLLIGPQYAPVRSDFTSVPRSFDGEVNEILVTSGSTNPDNSLEKMVSAACEVFPCAKIKVAVGSKAIYSGDTNRQITLLYDMANLAPLMKSCDIAISAAGTTLYELCAVGTPTVAVPIVDNQIKNVIGFLDSGMGLGAKHLAWKRDDVVASLGQIASDPAIRSLMSEKMREAVDGSGAERIALSLHESTASYSEGIKAISH